MKGKKPIPQNITLNIVFITIHNSIIALIYFVSASLLTGLLANTMGTEHTCDRLESNYVECQPKILLRDQVLRQNISGYRLINAFSKLSKRRTIGFAYN